MTPTTTPPEIGTAATAYPPEVEAFCAAHGLREHLDTAVRLAREVYPTMLGYTTEVEDDPESPRRWVTVRVVVPPGILGDGSTSRAYSSRLVRAVPPDFREWLRLAAHTG